MAKKETWQEQYNREEKEKKAKAAKELAKVVGRLRESHPEIDEITLEYEGYGDSGEMQELNCYSGEATVEVPSDIEQELESLCYSFCPSGYENNDGGGGTITISIPKKGKPTLKVEHYDNEMVKTDAPVENFDL